MLQVVTEIGVSRMAGTLLPVWLTSLPVTDGTALPVASATAAVAASSASSFEPLVHGHRLSAKQDALQAVGRRVLTGNRRQ